MRDVVTLVTRNLVGTPERITRLKYLLPLTFTLLWASVPASAQTVYIPANNATPSRDWSTSSDCTQTMGDFKKALAEDKRVKDVNEAGLTDKSVLLIKAGFGFNRDGGSGKVTFEKTTSGGCLVTAEGLSPTKALKKVEKEAAPKK